MLPADELTAYILDCIAGLDPDDDEARVVAGPVLPGPPARGAVPDAMALTMWGRHTTRCPVEGSAGRRLVMDNGACRNTSRRCCAVIAFHASSGLAACGGSSAGRPRISATCTRSGLVVISQSEDNASISARTSRTASRTRIPALLPDLAAG